MSDSRNTAISIDNNPFPPRKDNETMKYIIRNERGELYQRNIWFAGMVPSEMSSRNVVQAFWEAQEIDREFLVNEDKYVQRKYAESNWDNENFANGDNSHMFHYKNLTIVDDMYLELKSVVVQFVKEVLDSPISSIGEYDFSPLHVASYRVINERSYMKRAKKNKDGVKVREMSIHEMFVMERTSEDKTGFVVEFRSHIKNSLGQSYSKKWPAIVYINKTPNGVRILWKNKKTGEVIWGVGYLSLVKKKLVPECSSLLYAFSKIKSALIKPEDILKIMKYMPEMSDDRMNQMNYEFDQHHYLLHPHGITQSQIFWIGSSTSVKDILNKAFNTKKDDQGRPINGITKKAFGGLNNINTMERLMAAISITRMLRGFNPHVFEKLTINGSEDFKRWKTADIELVQTFFRYFGNSEEIAQNLIVQRRESTMWMIVDTVRAFKQIKSNKLRRAITDEINRQKMTPVQLHDYVMAEWEKISHKDQKLSHTTMWKQFGKLHNKWISDEIQLVLPSSTHQLIEWGNTQSNCMGSYGEQVHNNETIIVGFKGKDGEWIGHAQFDYNGKLHQLLGKYNQSIEDQHKKVITNFLDKEMNIHIGNYWGK